MIERSFRRLAVVAAVLASLLVVACTTSQGNTQPPRDVNAADPLVTSLVRGLAAFDVSKVAFINAASDAQDELAIITKGLGKVRPEVSAGPITYADQQASVPLVWRYAIGTQQWTYSTTAQLTLVGKEWRANWRPTLVHQALSGATRLALARKMPKRAAIVGSDKLALAEASPVTQVGIDKANLKKEKWEPSARKLAVILDLDQDVYAKRVLESGDRAFVIAKTVRQGKLPEAVSDVAGVYLRDTTRVLAPSESFAIGLLGVTGEATAEILEQAKGEIVQGDIVGLTGLQRRHDKQLRGVAGFTVSLRKRADDDVRADPQPSVSPSPGASATPQTLPATLYSIEPVRGEPLQLMLDREAQFLAEEVLKDVKGIASLVVMDSTTGAVKAAANSPDSGANPFATAGSYPPGSTFKVVTTLALLRKGLTPDSIVNCSPTYTVSGRSFGNYEGYPKYGNVPLSSAFAHSCNTAFMRAGGQLSHSELMNAAASLGLGVDYNPGFLSYYGLIPAWKYDIGKATDMIGQGQVTASPMAMAGVVTSVVAGRTIVPWMIEGKQPAPKAQPLTPAEAQTLRTLMRGVVTSGTASSMKGIVDGAKTGTAQFGTGKPRWHAWMIAWRGNTTVAAFVYTGKSGSGTAGPLIKKFFAKESSDR